MRPVGELIGLFEVAEEIRLLHDQRGDVLPGIRLQRFEQRAPCRSIEIHRLEHDSLLARDGLRHLRIGGIDRARQQNAARTRGAIGAHRHETGFGQCGSAVVHRGVRYLHARQGADHGLVLVDQLQGALARLRLVRRIRGIKFAARGNGPHRRRNVVFVGPGADEIQGPAIARGAFGQ